MKTSPAWSQTAMAMHIHRIVRSCDGNKSQAARILQCDPKKVQKYLRIYEELLERKGDPFT
ncbi:hypothetical protein GF402_02185 [Candidatus Fermentibacteria bacterium]|nr:hypothetical protein [Candidatus Fermentibacteria bacterium]